MSTLMAAGTLRPARTDTHTLQAGSAGLVEVTVADRDRTRPFLLLHGGGGVMTMAGFADLLAERTHSRVLLPTHPGFGGTPKPDGLTNVTRLAADAPSCAFALYMMLAVKGHRLVQRESIKASTTS